MIPVPMEPKLLECRATTRAFMVDHGLLVRAVVFGPEENSLIGALRSFLTTSPFLYISSENWRCEMVSFEQLS